MTTENAACAVTQHAGLTPENAELVRGVYAAAGRWYAHDSVRVARGRRRLRAQVRRAAQRARAARGLLLRRLPGAAPPLAIPGAVADQRGPARPGTYASQAIHAEHAVTITGDLLEQLTGPTLVVGVAGLPRPGENGGRSPLQDVELLQAAPEIRVPAAAPERLPVPVADGMRHAHLAGRAPRTACHRGYRARLLPGQPDGVTRYHNRARPARAVATLRP